VACVLINWISAYCVATTLLNEIAI
jgi:hypothetical protein